MTRREPSPPVRRCAAVTALFVLLLMAPAEIVAGNRGRRSAQGQEATAVVAIRAAARSATGNRVGIEVEPPCGGRDAAAPVRRWLRPGRGIRAVRAPDGSGAPL